MPKLRPFLLIIVHSFFLISNSYGQNHLALLGKPISDIDVYEDLYALSTSQKKESYQILKNRYEIKFQSKGIDYVFNYNGTLVSLVFYDSGAIYQAYKGDLPLGLKFSMFLTDIKDDLLKFPDMIISKDNPFKGTIENENWTCSIYFKDYFVNVIKIQLTQASENDADQKNLKKWGVRLLSDGICLNGNCLDGLGEMVWGKDSSINYIGNWQDGLPHGKGKYRDLFGRVYDGEFKFGFFWGQGKLNYSKNYKYEGEFLLGYRQGKGHCRFENGMIYNGRYIQDMMNGIGKFYLNNSDYYEGEMQNNKFHGWGKLSNSKGYHEGFFKFGQPHGKGEQFNGQTISGLEGNWVNGKKEGKFIQRDPFGKGQTVYFKNDQMVTAPPD